MKRQQEEGGILNKWDRDYGVNETGIFVKWQFDTRIASSNYSKTWKDMFLDIPSYGISLAMAKFAKEAMSDAQALIHSKKFAEDTKLYDFEALANAKAQKIRHAFERACDIMSLKTKEEYNVKYGTKAAKETPQSASEKMVTALVRTGMAPEKAKSLAKEAFGV